jgi:hypothetical protein
MRRRHGTDVIVGRYSVNQLADDGQRVIAAASASVGKVLGIDV